MLLFLTTLSPQVHEDHLPLLKTVINVDACLLDNCLHVVVNHGWVYFRFFVSFLATQPKCEVPSSAACALLHTPHPTAAITNPDEEAGKQTQEIPSNLVFWFHQKITSFTYMYVFVIYKTL